MYKKKIILVFLLIVLISYGGYTIFSHDNRTANNLSAYCNIDFRGVADPQINHITDATLSIVDFRYASRPLEKFFILTIDGKRFNIDSMEISAQPPTYSPKDFSIAKSLQYTNTLFITFSPEVLKEIALATTVEVSFKYTDSNAVIKLPLSPVDLQYWKKQLLPL